MLLTTQYMEEAEQLASELTVIDRGKVIAGGRVAELKAKIGGRTLHIRPADPAQLPAMAQAISESGLAGISGTQAVPDEGLLTVPILEATDNSPPWSVCSASAVFRSRPYRHPASQPGRGFPGHHRPGPRPHPTRCPRRPPHDHVHASHLSPTAEDPADSPLAGEGRIGLRSNLRHIGALVRRNALQIKQDPESMFECRC